MESSSQSSGASSEASSKRPSQRLSLGLVHWPVLDRAGDTVVTSITNFDIHDIARACRTYGLENYYIINRLPEQLMFVTRNLNHWRSGYGSKFNPMRKTAMGMIKTAETVEKALAEWPAGEKPVVVATAARDLEVPAKIGFSELRTQLEEQPDRPVLLLFGTGFGMTPELLEQCDYLLEPIKGPSADDYRHLSVRSAVSICLDRLLGKW